MMLKEFEEKLGKEIPPIDWQAIETVYMWHPAFERSDGKKVTVELYKLMGVRPFLEMYDTAVKAQELNEKVRAAKSVLAAAEQEKADFYELNK